MLPPTLRLPGRRRVTHSHWGTAALALLLLLSLTAGCVQSTTVEHDLHIVHNVDNRSPEIDPFWYVGRGVRPIGRFGKRQTAGGLRHVLSSLELLLSTLRDKENLRSALAPEEPDWIP